MAEMPMGGQGMQGGMPPLPPMPKLPSAGGPTSSPMTTPQPNEGLQKAARVNVQMAIKLLQRELPNFELDSNEGKALMNALKTLSNGFGKTEDKDRELIPSEILQLLSAVGPGAKTPGQMAMAGAPTPGMAPPPTPGAPS